MISAAAGGRSNLTRGGNRGIVALPNKTKPNESLRAGRSVGRRSYGHVGQPGVITPFARTAALFLQLQLFEHCQPGINGVRSAVTAALVEVGAAAGAEPAAVGTAEGLHGQGQDNLFLQGGLQID